MLELIWAAPPAFSVTVPTTTRIPLSARPRVHIPVVTIYRFETIEPPQK